MLVGMLRQCILLLGILALRAVAAEVAEPLALIGFHEGTRRTVECKGGFITGVEVGYVEDSWSFAEPFIGSVRFLCSNKTISVEWMPDADDSMVFGRLDLKTYRKAECSGHLGVAGFKSRPASIKNPDGAEARQGGLVLLCNRADNAPLEVALEFAPKQGVVYKTEFGCKQVAKYAGLPAPKVTKVLMWWNRKSFAGMEPIECA